MNQSLLHSFVQVAEAAAIEAAKWNGRGDKVAADQAATTAMRDAFNQLDFRGRIVIGEGERDEAPMLFIGEELGKGGSDSPEIDIAVDPLEGTNLCADNRPDSICTIAVAPKGGLLFAPDTYLNKLAVGPKVKAKGGYSIDNTPEDNVKAVAVALGKDIADVNVCVLLRDRHEQLIQRVRACGAKVTTIDDGDVLSCIATSLRGGKVDLYLGSGGAPEGVLAAAGLKAIGGDFQARFEFRNDSEVERAKQTAGVDLDGVLTSDMLVRTDDCAFIATGVTSGELLQGVKVHHGKITTNSLILNAADKSVQFLLNKREVQV